MKLVHVVPRIDREAAGPSYSVPRLCGALAARGHEVELSCIAARESIPGVRLDLHPEWPILKRFEVSTSLARALRRKAAEVDIVHNHSLWSMVNVASGLVVPGRGAKLVTSPRGTLSAWALSRTRRLKSMLRPLQWRALTQADLLHATSDAEYAEIRAQGIDSPISIVPNGIDVPVDVFKDPTAKSRRVLSLGRLHPTKNLDSLLRAWRQVEEEHADWELVIAGSDWNGYQKEMQELAKSLGLLRVDFPGPLYGARKSAAYFSADLFILASHSENFGMVVAEALAHGCPVISSKGAPWQGLEAERCGWWVGNEVQALAETLNLAMKQSQADLASMGARGRSWMRREFSWSSLAERMDAAYSWVLDGGRGRPPDCVRLN